jgi:monoamine oxidase
MWAVMLLLVLSSNPADAKKKATRAIDTDVIVVGAGVAGLSAARDLRAAGLKVVILEGRTRTGGRIYTDPSPASGPVELGAGWIHGSSAGTQCAQ